MWAFKGVRDGLVADLEGLYDFGRAVLVQSENQFDAWDMAFESTFAGVELMPELSPELLDWLKEAAASLLDPCPGGAEGPHPEGAEGHLLTNIKW